MKFLLDTHVIIWHFDDSPKLPKEITEIMKNSESKFYISSISLWEIAIKMNLNKLDLSITFDELLSAVKKSDINILQIEDQYLQGLSVLPFIHRDPFDRMLIATAKSERLTILTADENIQKYDVAWVW